MASNAHSYDPDEKELQDLISKGQEEAMNKITNIDEWLSVLVAGASSNGKSSVVSRTFGLDVGIGRSGATTTKGIREYTCKEKRLSLIDTPGLEKKNNDETINNLRKCTPDILWLVLNFGSSIEAEELSIPELFPQVPTIVVLNKVDTLQYNKFTDDDIKDFDCLNIDDQVVFPEKLKRNQKLMAVRQRLIDWKLTRKANIHRILITSLRNEMPSDQPVGLINLCEATWMSCGYVASVTFTQAQQVYQDNMINGSIAIVMSSTAVASGCAWIPIPGVDYVTTAGVQWGMLCSLCKLWGMSGNNVKIFLNVMTRNAAPVLASFGIGFSLSNILKCIPVFGSVAGGTANSCIAGTFTLIMGALATVYLKSVHHTHSTMTEEELQEDMNKYMQSNRFKTFVEQIKTLAKNPTKINRNELTRLVQDL